MNRLLVLLCLLLLGCNGGNSSYPKAAHFDQVLIGRETAGSNLEKLQGYVYYNSAEVSENYPNPQEWHVVYRDEVPAPEDAKWRQLRGNWTGVLMACPWHLDKAEGMSAGVGTLPGGEEGTVGTAVGIVGWTSVGEEQIGVRGHVADTVNGFSFLGNAALGMVDSEGNKHRGYTGDVPGVGYFIGGAFMGPAEGGR